MARNYLKKYTSVHLPRLWEQGGQTLTMNGTTQWLTLPSDCECLRIEVEAQGGIYYAINDNAADATAHGYIAGSDWRFIGPMANMSSFSVWGTNAGAAVVHIQYFREA